MLSHHRNSQNSIKDNFSPVASFQKGQTSFFYVNKKTDKLITALYLVTDIMDKDEPLRNKLRTLGTDILLDSYDFSSANSTNLIQKDILKINQILSFLEIAFTVGIISNMNFEILKKEFFLLKEALLNFHKPFSIEDFLTDENESSGYLEDFSREYYLPKNENQNIKTDLSKIRPIGQAREIGQTGLRLGVQKGGTLLNALKDIKNRNNFKNSHNLSNKKINNPIKENILKESFNKIKNERKEIILNIIQKCPLVLESKEGIPNGRWATIKDILTGFKDIGLEVGEKTLQRELISMVSNGILYKAGEKRWSKYSIAKLVK